MPELPEVEAARRLIADQALGRRIVAVDDADTPPTSPSPLVCRPHSPGELRDALTGRMLTAARRRGKAMWCETSGLGRSAGLDVPALRRRDGARDRRRPLHLVVLPRAGRLAGGGRIDLARCLSTDLREAPGQPQMSSARQAAARAAPSVSTGR